MTKLRQQDRQSNANAGLDGPQATNSFTSGSRELRTDSSTTGSCAAGKASFSGTNTPWSHPRAASAAASMPAPLPKLHTLA